MTLVSALVQKLGLHVGSLQFHAHSAFTLNACAVDIYEVKIKVLIVMVFGIVPLNMLFTVFGREF